MFSDLPAIVGMRSRLGRLPLVIKGYLQVLDRRQTLCRFHRVRQVRYGLCGSLESAHATDDGLILFSFPACQLVEDPTQLFAPSCTPREYY